MARGKRKKQVAVQENTSGDEPVKPRRSSMRVNLSYVSNLSDSGNAPSPKRTSTKSDEVTSEESTLTNEDHPKAAKKSKSKKANVDEDEDAATPASAANVTVIQALSPPNGSKVSEDVQSTSLTVIREKEQQLNKTCMRLKDAIMNKTQALFDKETELAIKTSEVLSPGYKSPVRKVREVGKSRSPSVKVNIGKNDQIVILGDGRKEHPVEVNSMLKRPSPEREQAALDINEDSMDCNQSIASTPKKSRLEASDKEKDSSGKSSETLPRIPVARLFAEGNDPNNSMSEISPPQTVISLKGTDANDNASKVNNISNISRLSNELNHTISPILSQGTRRSRLSLKKKLTKTIMQTSRLSTNGINESFVNRIPLTSSSFIERQNCNNVEKSNEKEVVKNCMTIDLGEKSDTNNGKAINVDESDSSKTLEVENCSSRSSMELTTDSAKMPIIRRTFQNIIRNSLKLDNISNTHEGRSFNQSTQKQTSPSVNQSKNAKEATVSELTQKVQNNGCQDDCTVNTVRTSLNVNTSLDQIISADPVVQKENQIPNNLELTKKGCPNHDEENDAMVIPRLSTCTVRCSMRVNTSLDSVRKSSSSKNTSNEESEKSDKITVQPTDTVNREKENNDKVVSRPSTSTIRSSMHVNTSLDSVRKSPVMKTVLDINKMLSMVEETSSTEDQSKASVYTSKNQSSGSDSQLENVSLMERIRNISATKQAQSTEEPNEKSISARKSSKANSTEEPNKKSINARKSSEAQNNRSNATRKSDGIENTSSSDAGVSSEEESNDSSTIRKSGDENSKSRRKSSTRIEDTSSKSRKSNGANHTNSSTNESSVVEATPYPTSRSVLLRTIIKNNIAMNTLDPRKFVDSSDDEKEFQSPVPKKTPNKRQSVYARKKSPSPNLKDTVVLDSSDESAKDSDTDRDTVIIEESANESDDQRMPKNNKINNNETLDDEKDKRAAMAKRKLYPLRENSQLVSFSAAEISDAPEEIRPKEITPKKKKKRKLSQKKKKQQESKKRENSPERAEDGEPVGNVEVEPEDTRKRKTRKATQKKREKSPEPDAAAADESELLVEDDVFPKKVEKAKKKPRKIISKKIVIKKMTNMNILDTMMQNEEAPPQRVSDRNSLGEFDLRRGRRQQKQGSRKNYKIVIVVTGLSKDQRDLVKTVIKALGSAILEANVTPRTTHIISSGVRTINLLKGIIRGCWLLSLEWALKSLENEKWLDPNPYEMCHFSKAVQENRRDRQLFGKAYMPELFVTSGFIYIENGTSPPAPCLKELVKIAGGRITEDPNNADIVIGSEGLKEIWILDSITTGEVQSIDQYKRN